MDLKPADQGIKDAGIQDAVLATLMSSERAPPLQGTISLHPKGCLQRIAKKANVDPSALSTATVTDTTQKLYRAITEYAAFTESSDSPNGRDALFVSPFKAFEDREDSSDEEDSDSDSDSWNMYNEQFVRGGIGKPHAPVPKFHYALGETSVSWPPPPELLAENLVASRLGRGKKDIAANGGIDRVALLSEKSPGPTPEERCADDCVDGGCREGEGAKQSTIYMVHYSIGDPIPLRAPGIVNFCVVLLASVDGPAAIRRFCKEVIQWQIDKDFRDGRGKKFALHRFKTDDCGGAWWHYEGMKRSRPPSSVILCDGQMEAILADIKKFLQPETKKWYVAHGLPHRRSYLFYGPPGTGKTSTIRAMASSFALNCCFLSMTSSKFSNQMLGDALGRIPPNALLVIEDVDALFNEDRKNEQGTSLTFSGMLNALDGVISVDGIVTVMTTNHLERLDRALVRGGRVDRRFHFGSPERKQIEALFCSFYPDAGEELAKEFSEVVLGRSEMEARSIATLQQLFIHQREASAAECIASVPSFFEEHFPPETAEEKKAREEKSKKAAEKKADEEKKETKGADKSGSNSQVSAPAKTEEEGQCGHCSED